MSDGLGERSGEHRRQRSMPEQRQCVINSSGASVDDLIDQHFQFSLKPQNCQDPGKRQKRFPDSIKAPKHRYSSNSVHHSRDNSDSSGHGTLSPGVPTGSLAPMHTRAISSPAVLHQSGLSLAASSAPFHQASRSLDAHQLLDGGYPEAGSFPVDSYGRRSDLTDERRSVSAGNLRSELPSGWEMAYTDRGEPYFIDHNKQETTWYDPRIPISAQRQMIIQRHAVQSQVPSTQQRLQDLEQERRRMQERQQEIAQQGLLTDRSPPSMAMSPQPMQPRNFPGMMDPSLSAGAGEMMGGMHGRQASTDSGLGAARHFAPMEMDLLAPGMDLDPPNMMQIDPASIVQFDAQSIDPRELDQYLNICDERKAFMR